MYKPVIGFEIHVQLKTKSKLFGPAPMGQSDEPNVNIDEIVTGEPGVLPVLNKEAVHLGLRLGLALNCEIPEISKFDRKHYFYPDLPKGYQISQYDEPVCGKGHVDIEVNGQKKRIGITRAHLEEDAGKNVHPAGMNYSLIDLNRAGAPLLEIVTDPVLESSEEAQVFLTELRNIIRYVGASDADMEKGSMRVEPNISVRRPEEESLPKYKVEVKNINSIRFAKAAIDYEITRQTEILEKGETPKQVTMGWDEKNNRTVEQRSKEDAADYRYFPDPDLPLLRFDRAMIESMRNSLPELPSQKRVRFRNEYGLKDADIDSLINYKELTFYFEEVVSELMEWQDTDAESRMQDINKLVKAAANWCLQDFMNLLKTEGVDPDDTKVTPENFAELLILIEEGKVSGSAAKQVFKFMFEKGGEPDSIIHDLRLAQISDTSAIEAAVRKVVAENPKAVADYKSGEQKSFGFLVGQSMKELKGQGNPQVVNELLKKILSE